MARTVASFVANFILFVILIVTQMINDMLFFFFFFVRLNFHNPSLHQVLKEGV